jgi:hypothetical protein
MTTKYPILTVLAAANRAATINGQYVKFTVPALRDPDGRLIQPEKLPNRVVIAELLKTPDVITTRDYEQAEKIRTFLQGLTLKFLQRGALSQFDNKLLTLANLDEVSTDSLAILAYSPYLLTQYEEQEYANTKRLQADKSYLGTVNTKVSATAEVIRINYSQQYSCYFIEAVTSCNHKVFFSYKHPLVLRKQYEINGNVKSERDDYLTQLNYVKLKD